jgi:hypothetical protein
VQLFTQYFPYNFGWKLVPLSIKLKKKCLRTPHDITETQHDEQFCAWECWHVFNEKAILGINHRLILQLFWPPTLRLREVLIACECICIFNSLALAHLCFAFHHTSTHTQPFAEHMQGAEWHKSSAGQASRAGTQQIIKQLEKFLMRVKGWSAREMLPSHSEPELNGFVRPCPFASKFYSTLVCVAGARLTHFLRLPRATPLILAVK